METNRIAALCKKHRHSFPSAAPVIPSMPHSWQAPVQALFAPTPSMEHPNQAPVSSVPGAWNGWQVSTMPNQPTPYAGYISILPVHPPVMADLSNVKTSCDPDHSPSKKKNNNASGDPLIEATLTYADATTEITDFKDSKPETVASVEVKSNVPPCEIKIKNTFYRYTFHKDLANGCYRMKCSFYRNTKCKGCTAFVKVYPKGDGTERIISDGTHAQACEGLNGRKVQVHDASKDCSVAMHQFIEERCVSEQHRTDLPEKIWNDTMAHFRESLGSNFNGMTKNKAKSLVYNARERSFGGDGISKTEQLFSGSEDRAFLREHRLFVDKDGMQWMMCFSLPMLLALLKYPKVRLYYHFSLLHFNML